MKHFIYKYHIKDLAYALPAVLLTLVLLAGVFQGPFQPVTAANGNATPDIPLLINSGESANVTPEGPVFGEFGETLTLPQFEPPEKGNPKLDSQLNRMVEKAGLSPHMFSPETTENITPSAGNEEVTVVMECLPEQAAPVTQAAGALGTYEISYDNLVQMKVPVSNLTALAEIDGVKFVRMPYRPVEFAVSEGRDLINANDWYDAGLTGTGVRIGILDVGFANYSNLQSQGEVPPYAGHRWSPSIGQGSSIHGTACTEVVYDIAPGADYYLANINTDTEWGAAVDWLVYTCHVDIISCSIGFTAVGPAVNNKVAEARSQGVIWSQAAGNYAQTHWMGVFSDAGGGWNNFSGGDALVEIPSHAGYLTTVEIRWADPWGTSGNDYDLYLFYDINGDSVLTYPNEVVDYSNNRQNGSGGDDYPYEIIQYPAAYTGWYYIAIKKYSGGNVNIHLYADYYYAYPMEHAVASGSLCIPADSPNAMTVGAVFWNDDDNIEPFSSQGPNDNNDIKPDLVAPDGNSGATYGASDGETWEHGGHGFFGTSAAAPHAAGAAALVKQCFPTYNADQIQSYLENNAIDLGAGGEDNVYGFGRLYLPTYTLTISSVGNGSTTPASGSHTYPSGTIVDLEAIPDTYYMFVNWTGDTGTIADVNDPTTTITMNGNYSITANFKQPELTMATTAGGNVTPAAGTYECNYGEIVNIIGTPDEEHVFKNWTGDTGNIADTNSNNTTVTMYGDYTITGNFGLPELTITVSGSGNVTPEKDIPHPYNIGTVVPISANASLKWEFTNWFGETNTVDDPSLSSTNITMNDDYSITANFTRTHGTLNLITSGTGNVTMSPVSDNNSTYFVGDTVNITATPGSGYRFVNWTGDDVSTVTDTSSNETTVIINGDYIITAVFDQPVLTIAVSGSGSVSPSAGSHPCDFNSTVDIVATPASGYRFVNWTGDVNTVASPNSATTNITMDDDYSITANFAVIQQNPGGGGPGGGGGSSGGVNGKTITSLRGSLSASGEAWADIEASSLDTKCTLFIPYGVRCTNANGYALTSVTITQLNEPDPAQTGVTIIGTVYELGPSGASFDPPITLTIQYSESDLPEGIPESSLKMAIWDAESGTYKTIPCQADTGANVITAFVSHFSRYTIIAAPRPASFLLSDLSISPSNVKAGDAVSISVTVGNIGDLSGDYTCSVSVNGATKDSKTVTINAGEKTTVSFSVTAEGEGLCRVSVGSLTGTFTISSPASFKIGSLSIIPSEVNIGGKATVTVTVSNNGSESGTYKVTLNINGTIEETKDVTLSGGAVKQVSFTVTGDAAGKKLVDINGLTGDLTVLEPVPEKSPLPVQELTTPEPETPVIAGPTTFSPDTERPKKISLIPIFIIIGIGVLVIVLAILYVTKWRK